MKGELIEKYYLGECVNVKNKNGDFYQEYWLKDIDNNFIYIEEPGGFEDAKKLVMINIKEIAELDNVTSFLWPKDTKKIEKCLKVLQNGGKK